MLANKETLPISVRISARLLNKASVVREQNWMLASEVPVALIYNGKPYSVMMATPDDLVDYAIGFTLSEEVVTSIDAIEECYIDCVDNAIRLFISIDEKKTGAGWDVKRTISGRTSCGMCGMAELEQAVRVTPNRIQRNFEIDGAAILNSFEEFKSKQKIFAENRSVHGAAFCNAAGDVLLISEDVGRHNALDKLIGRVLKSTYDPKDGFILMSSRCSYELVKKAVTMGFGGLVTVSAPTSLAFDMARDANLFLAAKASDSELMVFVD